MLPGRLSRKAELYGKARSTGCGLATSEFREGVGDGLQLRNSENSENSEIALRVCGRLGLSGP